MNTVVRDYIEEFCNPKVSNKGMGYELIKRFYLSILVLQGDYLELDRKGEFDGLV